MAERDIDLRLTISTSQSEKDLDAIQKKLKAFRDELRKKFSEEIQLKFKISDDLKKINIAIKNISVDDSEIGAAGEKIRKIIQEKVGTDVKVAFELDTERAERAIKKVEDVNEKSLSRSRKHVGKLVDDVAKLRATEAAQLSKDHDAAIAENKARFEKEASDRIKSLNRSRKHVMNLEDEIRKVETARASEVSNAHDAALAEDIARSAKIKSTKIANDRVVAKNGRSIREQSLRDDIKLGKEETTALKHELEVQIREIEKQIKKESDLRERSNLRIEQSAKRKSLTSSIVGDSKPIDELNSKLNRTLYLTRIIGGLAGGISFTMGFRNAIELSRDFNHSMQEVKSLMGDVSDYDFNKLKKSVRELSRDTAGAGKGAVELSEGLLRIIKSNFKLAESSEIAFETLKQATSFAASGFGEVEDSAAAAITIMNALGKGQSGTADFNKELDNTFNILFEIIRLGQTNLTEVAQFFPKILPSAERAGFGIEETAAAFSFLTLKLGSAAKAWAPLSRFFDEFVKRPANISQLIGKSVRDVEGNTRPLLDIITEIQTAFVALGAHGGEGFEALATRQLGFTERSSRALSSFASDTGLFNELLGQLSVNAITGETRMKAFNDALESTDVQLNTVKNSLDDAVRQIGDFFIPALVKAGGVITDVDTSTISLSLAFLGLSGVGGGLTLLLPLLKDVTAALKTLPKVIYGVEASAAAGGLGAMTMATAFGTAGAAFATLSGLLAVGLASAAITRWVSDLTGFDEVIQTAMKSWIGFKNEMSKEERIDLFGKVETTQIARYQQKLRELREELKELEDIRIDKSNILIVSPKIEKAKSDIAEYEDYLKRTIDKATEKVGGAAPPKLANFFDNLFQEGTNAPDKFLKSLQAIKSLIDTNDLRFMPSVPQDTNFTDLISQARRFLALLESRPETNKTRDQMKSLADFIRLLQSDLDSDSKKTRDNRERDEKKARDDAYKAEIAMLKDLLARKAIIRGKDSDAYTAYINELNANDALYAESHTFLANELLKGDRAHLKTGVKDFKDAIKDKLEAERSYLEMQAAEGAVTGDVVDPNIQFLDSLRSQLSDVEKRDPITVAAMIQIAGITLPGDVSYEDAKSILTEQIKETIGPLDLEISDAAFDKYIEGLEAAKAKANNVATFIDSKMQNVFDIMADGVMGNIDRMDVAFKNMIKGWVKMLLSQALQAGIFSLITGGIPAGNIFSMFTGGGNANFVGPPAPKPFASGGYFDGSGGGHTGNLPSSGALFRGHGGEYILNKDVVNTVGKDNLDALNAGISTNLAPYLSGNGGQSSTATTNNNGDSFDNFTISMMFDPDRGSIQAQFKDAFKDQRLISAFDREYERYKRR